MAIKIIKKVPTDLDFEILENGSALTMTGYMPKELHLYVEAISHYVKKDELEVYVYTAKELNAARGTNLPEDLNMFSISLDDLKDVNTLAVKERFQYGFRWLDDVVDNNRVREEA